ncbi:glycosyltransferase family 4 protein [candidate division KSB1 bacterium]|nr:glycosyltransferase family 4 protein [candidate division KSB1 bacterium]
MNFLFPYMARWNAINWTRYHQIFSQIAKLGHQVYVFQPPSQRSEETNYQEIEMPIPANFHLNEIALNQTLWKMKFPLNKLVKKGYYSLASTSQVQRFIREHQIDVMLLYNIPQYPLLNVKNCPIIFDFADDYIEMLRHELGALHRLQILRFGQYLLNRMIRRSNMTLAVSKVLGDKIGNTARVLPNGVDLSEFKAGSGAEIRQKYEKPIIGFIGSFEYFIDFNLILKAAAKMRDKTFLLVGSGRELNWIKSRVEAENLSNVHLTGGVPHNMISRYIDAMDICLNIFKKTPVSHSACPIKLFEYLAMKKPVISTRLDEVERINESFLYYADTVDELQASIERILEHPEESKSMIEKGYRVVEQKYNWDIIGREFVRLAEEAVAKRICLN